MMKELGPRMPLESNIADRLRKIRLPWKGNKLRKGLCSQPGVGSSVLPLVQEDQLRQHQVTGSESQTYLWNSGSRNTPCRSPVHCELSVGETVRLMTPHIFGDDALHTLLLSWYFLPLISGKCVRVTKSQQEGSESKGTCCQVRQHEFDPQNPHYGRREFAQVVLWLTYTEACPCTQNQVQKSYF